MAFTFRLDPLLRLRRLEEEVLRQELADRQRALDGVEAELAAARRELEGQWEALREEERGTIPVERVLYRRRYIATLRDRLAALEREREAAARAVADKRSEVVEAARARKGLEMLRERRYREYRREADRREQAALDELTARQPDRPHPPA